MKASRLALLFAGAMAACTGSPSVPSPSVSAPVGDHTGIVRLEIVPVPEGPPGSNLERDPTASNKWARSLSDVSESAMRSFAIMSVRFVIDLLSLDVIAGTRQVLALDPVSWS